MSAITLTKLQQARSRILLNHVFLGTLMLSVPMIRDDSKTPTACTNGKTIYYNQEFVDKLQMDELIFLVVHELAHIMFKHALRRSDRHPLLWNVAADFAINWLLSTMKFKIIDGVCLDQKYAGMSAEQIYDDLIKNLPPPPPAGSGGDPEGQGGQQQGQGGSGQQPNQQGKAGRGQGFPQIGGLGADLIEPEAMSPAERAETERQIDGIVAQAANTARMAGKMPAELDRAVGALLNPSVPWQVLLREYMTRITQDDESWNRRNRRISSVFMPAKHSLKLGPIVMIGDTSGSISNDELQDVATEISAIADTMQPSEIRIVWADTRVAGEQVFEVGEEVVIDPKGGGGTDMVVPLAYVEQYNPEIVILFTDCYTPWPLSEPPYPLIVISSTNEKSPIGQWVRYHRSK